MFSGVIKRKVPKTRKKGKNEPEKIKRGKERGRRSKTTQRRGKRMERGGREERRLIVGRKESQEGQGGLDLQEETLDPPLEDRSLETPPLVR